MNQTRLLSLPASESNNDRTSTSSSGSSTDSVSEDPALWVHHNSGLLRPVFKYVASTCSHHTVKFSYLFIIFVTLSILFEYFISDSEFD